MDAFIDLIAVLSLPGIIIVAAGQGVIGALLPALLLVGLVAPDGVPGPSPQATDPGEGHLGWKTTRSGD